MDEQSKAQITTRMQNSVAMMHNMDQQASEQKPEYARINVSVNDYPDHLDYELSEDIPYAYVNMYIVELTSESTFEVIDAYTRQTGSEDEPSVIFVLMPEEMVYFEGFKTLEGANSAIAEKMSMTWTAPPYKNFEGIICQTD